MTSLDNLALLAFPAVLFALARRAGRSRAGQPGARSVFAPEALSELLQEERRGARCLLDLVDGQREALASQEERIGVLERRHVWRDWSLEDLERRLFTMEGAVESCPHCADARAIAELLVERPSGVSLEVVGGASHAEAERAVVTPLRPRGVGSSDGGSRPRRAG